MEAKTYRENLGIHMRFLSQLSKDLLAGCHLELKTGASVRTAEHSKEPVLVGLQASCKFVTSIFRLSFVEGIHLVLHLHHSCNTIELACSLQFVTFEEAGMVMCRPYNDFKIAVNWNGAFAREKQI